MYARYVRRHLVGTETEAELLVELLTSWTVMLRSSPDSFKTVRGLTAELMFCLIRPPYTSAARAAECSSVRRELSMFPLTGMTLRGPGILSLR